MERENAMILRRVAPVLLVVGLTLAFGELVLGQQADPHVTLKIASRLGVEAEFVARSTKVDDKLLDAVTYAVCVPLELQPGLYVAVPPWDLKEATFSDGGLLVTLVNGSTVRGRGVGTIQGGPNQSFGVNSISRLAVVDMSADYGKQARDLKMAEDRWKMTAGTGASVSFDVRGLGFVFTYYSSSGYILGGSDHTVRDVGNFWIKQGNDELEASLASFKSIKITMDSKTRVPTITLTAPNGTVTAGELILKREDDKGWHGSSGWALHAYLEGVGRTAILAKQAPITLERIQ